MENPNFSGQSFFCSLAVASFVISLGMGGRLWPHNQRAAQGSTPNLGRRQSNLWLCDGAANSRPRSHLRELGPMAFTCGARGVAKRHPRRLMAG